MKLTCPGCAAKYTIPDERLNGRRVKVRCKRCGDTFAVDPEDRGEMCPESAANAGGPARIKRDESRRAPGADLFAGLATAGAEEGVVTRETLATREGPPLVGERNESSVLFSLAALSATSAPAATRTSMSTTESSSLIDIRALCGSTAADAAPSSSHADDLMNLSGGGVFASPLLAPPLTPIPVTEDESATPARTPRALLLAGVVVLLLVATTGVLVIALPRGAEASVPAPLATPPASPMTTSPLAAATPNAPPLAIDEAPIESAATTPGAPPVATSHARAATSARTPAARTSDTPPGAPTTRTATTTATATATPRDAAKCCPGETETTCQMRLSVGAACGDARSTSGAPTTAPSFDRAAAARALGVDVSSCSRPGGPTGPGHATVTFQPSGIPSAVSVDPPYAGTAAGACVAQRYRSASVPAFAGGALTVGKTFTIQ